MKQYQIAPDDNSVAVLEHYKLVMKDLGVSLYGSPGSDEITVPEGYESPYLFAKLMRQAVDDDRAEVYLTSSVYWCTNPAGFVAFGVPAQMDPKFHVPDDAAELKEYVELIKIPSVTFLMGSSADNTKAYSNEHPQHVVTVPSFLMGRYPVTQYQYKKVMGNNPSRFKGANRPVECVSWNEAVEFCQKLSEQSGKNYRLPTEAEWEHACRAGTTTSYFFGESLAKTQANYDYGSDSTTDVGSFPANDFGLYDMHGNVWEWCLDHWHDNYQGAPTDGSAWITDGDSNKRILRGGDLGICRSALRDRGNPGGRDCGVGFRVVCEIEATKSVDVTQLAEMITIMQSCLEDMTEKYNDASTHISELNREIDRYKAVKNTMQTALNSMILAKQQIDAEKSFLMGSRKGEA